MRRITALLAALALILTLLPSAVLAAPNAGGQRSAVIVVFKDSVASPAAAAADMGTAHGFGARFVYQHALKGFAASVPTRALHALSRDPRVAWVEPDQPVQRYAQTVPTGIQRIFADDNPNVGINGTDDLRVDVDVAIIDTGIDLDHPDLNVVDSTSCLYSSGGGPPWNRSYSCGSGGDDDNGHGTHVGGTVGALDNGLGVVGVAPGARLWAVKVLDANGSGSLGAVAAGIDYVTANANQIEVANMSLGCECSSQAMDTAIANSVDAGVTYAVAAGNSDANASTHSPANHPDVITVSALADFNGQSGGGAASTCRTDQDDTLADFSNWGSTVEIAAPGVCILSTVPGGGYDTFSGTSMASPHVAGAAALLASRGSSPATIESTLLAEGNFDWTDDSGDGVKEPLLDVSDATVFNPATVSGGGGGGGEPPPDENTAPTASNLTVTVDEGDTVEITLAGADAETCELTFAIVDDPEAGALDSPANNDCTSGSPNLDTATVAYTPSGLSDDSFTYKVTDGDGVDSTMASVTIDVVPTSGGGGIALSVTAYKVRGNKAADLTWNGATSTDVDVYRDGALVTTTANDGLYTHTTSQKGGGSHTYRICEAGTALCSNDATASY